MRADKGLGALQAVSTFRDEALVQGQQAENTGLSIILTSVHSVGRGFRLEEVNHKDQELSALPRPAHAEGDHTKRKRVTVLALGQWLRVLHRDEAGHTLYTEGLSNRNDFIDKEWEGARLRGLGKPRTFKR